LKDTIDIQKPVMMMHTSVAIAVHYHIHFGSPRHAWISIGSIDAIV
jgi:hypothetical protein